MEAFQYTGPNVISADGSRPAIPGVVWIRVSKDDDRWFPHTVTAGGKYSPLKHLDWVVRDTTGGCWSVEAESFNDLYTAVK